ncbi:hypothetical protein JB92DRAFT_2946120 [Gautieria morchelliformis]|nr:hypothetical protein JB92DRAFT_2946120 [Gautieria morchelliformis]
MVHLSPDSRLLVSLIKQEQAYAAQLHNLLNASGSSLSALAVYASSSPRRALSGADEALRNYGEALNDWIDQLRTIKSKEEEVANVGRDREILVTRLLKVSQKVKSPPPSLLHAAPDSSSNVSFPTLNSKITVAQTELQACESHLAESERELERHRLLAIGQGLKLRCEALVQCGRVWGEMGRRALSMVDELSGALPQGNGHASDFSKPLPLPRDHDRDSVLSSLTPSQSASQIGAASYPATSPPHENAYRLDIPPPHLLSEHASIPGSSRYASSVQDNGNSSSEDEGDVEVHENPRFQTSSLNRKRSVRTAPSTPARSSPVPFTNRTKIHGTSSDVGPAQGKRRDQRRTGIFGSIALLFRTSMNTKSAGSHSDGQWSTRTDRNIRNVKTDVENSSDEELVRTSRLRKGKGRPVSSDVGRASAVQTTQFPTLSPAASPARVKNKASGGKLSRAGASSVTAVEPGSAPRVRANTLTHPSSRSAVVDVQSAISGSHGRRASMDGRWGLTDPGPVSLDSSQSPSSTPVWRPPKQSTAAKAGSLMSIVEGVSHLEQDSDPSSRLEVVHAPGSQIAGLPLLIHHPPPLPATASGPASLRQTPASQKRYSLPELPTSATTRGFLSAPEKKPLRSAMRNPNRDRTELLSPSIPPLSLPGPLSPSLRPVMMSRSEIPSTILESPRQSVADTTMPQGNPRPQSSVTMKTDDSASISSYETGHENFDDEGLDPSTPRAPFTPSAPDEMVRLPPPHPPSPVHNVSPQSGLSDSLISERHEISSATSTDTAIGATPTRRKSVRMSSLPPQVSATPPALDEEEEDRSPWGRSNGKAEREDGWKSRVSTNNMAWDDSSSEDEVYKHARTALSRAERRFEKKTR